MTLLSVSRAGVDFGASKIFDNVSLTVAAGQRWGVVGRNGTGKTTLFRLLTGEIEPTRGEIAKRPGLRVSLLEQHREFGGAPTVWEAAAGPFAELLALERDLIAQAERLGQDESRPCEIWRESRAVRTRRRLHDRAARRRGAARSGLRPSDGSHDARRAVERRRTRSARARAPARRSRRRALARRADEPPRPRDDRLARGLPCRDAR